MDFAIDEIRNMMDQEEDERIAEIRKKQLQEQRLDLNSNDFPQLHSSQFKLNDLYQPIHPLLIQQKYDNSPKLYQQRNIQNNSVLPFQNNNDNKQKVSKSQLRSSSSQQQKSESTFHPNGFPLNKSKSSYGTRNKSQILTQQTQIQNQIEQKIKKYRDQSVQQLGNIKRTELWNSQTNNERASPLVSEVIRDEIENQYNIGNEILQQNQQKNRSISVINNYSDKQLNTDNAINNNIISSLTIEDQQQYIPEYMIPQGYYLTMKREKRIRKQQEQLQQQQQLIKEEQQIQSQQLQSQFSNIITPDKLLHSPINNNIKQNSNQYYSTKPYSRQQQSQQIANYKNIRGSYDQFESTLFSSLQKTTNNQKQILQINQVLQTPNNKSNFEQQQINNVEMKSNQQNIINKSKQKNQLPQIQKQDYQSSPYQQNESPNKQIQFPEILNQVGIRDKNNKLLSNQQLKRLSQSITNVLMRQDSLSDKQLVNQSIELQNDKIQNNYLMNNNEQGYNQQNDRKQNDSNNNNNNKQNQRNYRYRSISGQASYRSAYSKQQVSSQGEQQQQSRIVIQANKGNDFKEIEKWRRRKNKNKEIKQQNQWFQKETDNIKVIEKDVEKEMNRQSISSNQRLYSSPNPIQQRSNTVNSNYSNILPDISFALSPSISLIQSKININQLSSVQQLNLSLSQSVSIVDEMRVKEKDQIPIFLREQWKKQMKNQININNYKSLHKKLNSVLERQGQDEHRYQIDNYNQDITNEHSNIQYEQDLDEEDNIYRLPGIEDIDMNYQQINNDQNQSIDNSLQLIRSHSISDALFEHQNNKLVKTIPQVFTQAQFVPILPIPSSESSLVGNPRKMFKPNESANIKAAKIINEQRLMQEFNIEMSLPRNKRIQMLEQARIAIENAEECISGTQRSQSGDRNKKRSISPIQLDLQDQYSQMSQSQSPATPQSHIQTQSQQSQSPSLLSSYSNSPSLLMQDIHLPPINPKQIEQQQLPNQQNKSNTSEQVNRKKFNHVTRNSNKKDNKPNTFQLNIPKSISPIFHYKNNQLISQGRNNQSHQQNPILNINVKDLFLNIHSNSIIKNEI